MRRTVRLPKNVSCCQTRSDSSFGSWRESGQPAQTRLAFTFHARDIALHHGQPRRGHSDVLAADANVVCSASCRDVEHVAHAQRSDEQALIGKHQAAIAECIAARKQRCLIARDHQADAGAADVEQGEGGL